MIYQSNMAPRAKKMRWILPMVVFVGLLVMLYSIKARTLAARAQVDALEQTLVHERQVVQMLAAEIAHLEGPERLRALAKAQLGLAPTPVSRTLTLAEAAQTIAKKPEASSSDKIGDSKAGGQQ